MRKRLKEEAEELAFSMELWLGPLSKSFTINMVMHKFGVDAGAVRRAISILKTQGKLTGGGQEWNWPFGAIRRGRYRSWSFK